MDPIFYVLMFLINIVLLTYGIIYMSNAYKETDEKNKNSKKPLGILIMFSVISLLLLSIYTIYTDIKEKRIENERMRWGGY